MNVHQQGRSRTRLAALAGSSNTSFGRRRNPHGRRRSDTVDVALEADQNVRHAARRNREPNGCWSRRYRKDGSSGTAPARSRLTGAGVRRVPGQSGRTGPRAKSVQASACSTCSSRGRPVVGVDAVPVEQAVGRVARLLDLEDRDAGPEGVDRAGRQEHAVAHLRLEAVQTRRRSSRRRQPVPDSAPVDAGLQPRVDAAARLGVQDHPRFRLAAWPASVRANSSSGWTCTDSDSRASMNFSSSGNVRDDWRTRRAISASVMHQFAQRRPAERPVRHAADVVALVAQHPRLGDRPLGRAPGNNSASRRPPQRALLKIGSKRSGYSGASIDSAVASGLSRSSGEHSGSVAVSNSECAAAQA